MFGLALTLQQKLIGLAAFLIWSLGCFAGGYAYKWHRVSVEEAAHQATQETAQVTADAGAKASDAVDISHLQSALAASTSLSNRLLQQIKDQQNATPAADTCRLPAGLRDAINSSFTPGSR